VYVQGGARKVSPFFIPGSLINLLPGHISIKYGIQGPNISIVTACTTGTHNIGQAARMIAYGEVDAMICGGSEMATSPLGLAGFSAMRALSTRNDAPEKASRPWDRDHDGFVLGDGAGMMMLEEYEHAQARGAKIYAELIGFGMSADASHITTPSGVGAQTCMINALQDGRLNITDVDYINAHGTSTPAGDKAESDAMKVVFKEHAYNLAVSSTKSMTGHLLGAAGAVEAVVSVLTIRDQVVPPTINLDNPEEGCDLNYVAHHAQERRIRVALSNSFGFGGTNGSLAFRAIG
jgi:3-oxoacyl-[acyl-carrier-protein] synthase II